MYTALEPCVWFDDLQVVDRVIFNDTKSFYSDLVSLNNFQLNTTNIIQSIHIHYSHSTLVHGWLINYKTD